MFGPLADAAIDAVTILENDTIPDVVCGTGILARKVKEKIGFSAKIVGIDLNQNMIEIAESLNGDFSVSCERQVADVCYLLYESEIFSLVMYQQGIQYFPEKAAAICEIRRVLASKGRISLTISRRNSIFVQSVSDKLIRHVCA